MTAILLSVHTFIFFIFCCMSGMFPSLRMSFQVSSWPRSRWTKTSAMTQRESCSTRQVRERDRERDQHGQEKNSRNTAIEKKRSSDRFIDFLRSPNIGFETYILHKMRIDFFFTIATVGSYNAQILKQILHDLMVDAVKEGESLFYTKGIT